MGDHLADDPWFSRVVYVNGHVISYREYASGREECWLNGTVVAVDTIEKINADLSSADALNMFDDLTGMNAREWDRAYRRMCWSEWMDSRKTWWLGMRVTHAQERKLNARYLKYRVGRDSLATAVHSRWA